MFFADFVRDDPGTPLPISGSSLREDGESHREAWARIIRADPCAYCGGSGGTVDHIEPKSRSVIGLGGAHCWANFIGSCSRCNGRKATISCLEMLYRRRWSTGW